MPRSNLLNRDFIQRNKWHNKGINEADCLQGKIHQRSINANGGNLKRFRGSVTLEMGLEYYFDSMFSRVIDKDKDRGRMLFVSAKFRLSDDDDLSR